MQSWSLNVLILFLWMAGACCGVEDDGHSDKVFETRWALFLFEKAGCPECLLIAPRLIGMGGGPL